MPIYSMTGHGRGEVLFKGAKIIAELNAVNHRQFDLRLEMPPQLACMETEMRKMIHAAIARGSVAGRCYVKAGDDIPSQKVTVDYFLARQYSAAGRAMARKLNVKNDLSTSLLLTLPGVTKLAVINAVEKNLGRAVGRALQVALESLKSMRAAEGKSLAHDVRRRLGRLKIILAKIVGRNPVACRRYKEKLKTALASVTDNQPADKKLFREIISLAEKSGMDEELERSQSHLKQMDRLLFSEEPVGRTMDFLIQEMMREINTLGAKANDCMISSLVVKYKSELECIREQAQNIE